jgi:hypothetical protein
MADIPKRLLELAEDIEPFQRDAAATCTEAAYEIERWRSLARRRQDAVIRHFDRNRELEAENHALHKLLLKIDKALDEIGSSPRSAGSEWLGRIRELEAAIDRHRSEIMASVQGPSAHDRELWSTLDGGGTGAAPSDPHGWVMSYDEDGFDTEN